MAYSIAYTTAEKIYQLKKQLATLQNEKNFLESLKPTSYNQVYFSKLERVTKDIENVMRELNYYE
jgi:division protein CdvB (Snf7/Vps24/ESCRT-III family)